MKPNRFLRAAAVLLIITLPTFAFMSTTMARYTARAQMLATARVAGFDVQATPYNFGTDHMVYFHPRTRSHMGSPTNYFTVSSNWPYGVHWARNFSYYEQTFRIDITNTSQVSVRLRPEFFNILHGNATPGARTPIGHHRLGGNPALLHSVHTAPRIVNVHSYPARTAQQGNYGGPNHHAEGVFAAPGDTVRFYWDLEAHTYRHTLVDKHPSRGWLSGAFRISFDIIAVQVDYVPPAP